MSAASEQKAIIDIMYQSFMDQYHDEKKAIGAIKYIGQKVQEPGCKLMHFGNTVFIVTVSGKNMVEVHAMVGGMLTEAQKAKEIDKEMTKLIDQLKTFGTKILYTYMPPDKEAMFGEILKEYQFRKTNITGPDGKPYVAFYVTL
jgi:ADP-heptose:LPS heptosyltransferase